MPSNILVAFKNPKISETVAKMLTYGNFRPSYICSSGSELQKQLNYYSGGIIVCGYNLKDCSIIQLAEDVPKSFSIILIGNKSQMELFENDRIFRLSVPLHKDDLICSVSMLLNMDTNPNKIYKNPRNEKDEKFIRLAKETLIDRYAMTESQAHKYMQKKSMDSGKKLVDIAKIILN